MFASGKSTTPASVNLLQWLHNDEYLPQQQKIRAAKDKAGRDALKIFMPCITPSGIFSQRGKNYLLKHTGFIAIDIDLKGNEGIGNYHDLKNEICKIPNVAYCGLSVSGTGYWLLIPITHPDKHELHFKFIEQYFKSKNLIIDKACSDVARLRFYSFDPEAYYNHAAKPLQAYYRPPKPKATQYYQKRSEGQQLTGDVYKDASNFAMQKRYEFIEGQRHRFIFHLCSYLVSKGVKKSDAESWIDSNLMKLSEIKSNCIDYPYTNYTIGKEIHHIEANKQQKLLKPDKVLAPESTTKAPAHPIFLNDQLSTIQRPATYSLKQLQTMAIKNLSSTMLKDKAASKANYLKCWSEGMKEIINAAGFTEQQFLNSFF
jgi:hypothetical protein